MHFLSYKRSHALVGTMAAILALFSRPEPVAAGLITDLTASESPTGGGLLQYIYQLGISPASSLGGDELTINVGSGANLQSIMGPGGWDITYFAGDTSVLWSASDLTFDILPGQTGTFSFVSPEDATLQDYFVFGIDPVNFDFDLNQGLIDAPVDPTTSATPEPSTLTLLAMGFAGVVIYRRRNFFALCKKRYSETRAG